MLQTNVFKTYGLYTTRWRKKKKKNLDWQQFLEMFQQAENLLGGLKTGAFGCIGQEQHKPAFSTSLWQNTAVFLPFSSSQVVYKTPEDGNRLQEACHEPLMLHSYPGEILEELTRLEPQQQSLCSTTPTQVPLPLQHAGKPNMALIWPTPATNPIIKATCWNISHWHGSLQLKGSTVWVAPHKDLPLRQQICGDLFSMPGRVVHASKFKVVSVHRRKDAHESNSPHFLPTRTCPAPQCPCSSADWPKFLESS